MLELKRSKVHTIQVLIPCTMLEIKEYNYNWSILLFKTKHEEFGWESYDTSLYDTNKCMVLDFSIYLVLLICYMVFFHWVPVKHVTAWKLLKKKKSNQWVQPYGVYDTSKFIITEKFRQRDSAKTEYRILHSVIKSSKFYVQAAFFT